jgi:prepilin-type N-terminal cleavage/methylation domain-containing protein
MKKQNREHGFTFVEIISVLVILGILSAFGKKRMITTLQIQTRIPKPVMMREPLRVVVVQKIFPDRETLMEKVNPGIKMIDQ